MNIDARWTFVAAGMLAPVLAVTPQDGSAQTPSQIEYERQQREYRQQQEQQRHPAHRALLAAADRRLSH